VRVETSTERGENSLLVSLQEKTKRGVAISNVGLQPSTHDASLGPAPSSVARRPEQSESTVADRVRVKLETVTVGVSPVALVAGFGLTLWTDLS
jgi:hypothetical protein